MWWQHAVFWGGVVSLRTELSLDLALVGGESQHRCVNKMHLQTLVCVMLYSQVVTHTILKYV